MNENYNETLPIFLTCLKNPKDGVNPPSANEEQSSILEAPASTALINDCTLSTHTSILSGLSSDLGDKVALKRT